MPWKRVLVVSAVVLAVTGCEVFKSKTNLKDRSDNYQHAQVQSPIKVPEGLNDSHIQSIYRIPGVDNQQTTVSTQAPAPNTLPPSLVGNSNDSVNKAPTVRNPVITAGPQKLHSLRNLGQSYWLLAQYGPNTMWSALQEFFKTQDFQQHTADAIQGILETQWVARPDKPGTYEKYLFQMSRGVQLGSSELRITQVTRDQSGTQAAVNWAGGSSIKSREVAMLKRLAKYLDSLNIAPAVQLGAEHEGLKIINDKKQAYLALELDYARTWASVIDAAKKAGYQLGAVDNSRGTVWLSRDGVVVEQAKKGFLNKLLPKKEDTNQAFYLRVKPAGEYQSAVFVGAETSLSAKQQKNRLESLLPFIN